MKIFLGQGTGSVGLLCPNTYPYMSESKPSSARDMCGLIEWTGERPGHMTTE
jgi:hypothetical protein